MRHLRYVLVALVIGAGAAGPLPSAAAQTAPTYQSSDPSKGEMMDHPPAEVTVTFDQPLDQSSWMNVLDECGREVDAGAATVDLNELTVQIGDRTPSGMYEVVYKAVGLAGATGSSGSTFEFMVHHGEPCAGGKKKPHHDGKKKKDHRDHDDHRKDDRHDDHGDDRDDHSDHSGMTGMGSSGHTGHTPGPAEHDGGGHGTTGHGRHGRHGDSPEAPGGGTEPPPLATGTNVPVGADGQAVLLGLGLAVAVGVLGGWLLRLSGPVAGA